jgi:hypothetical protein
MLISIADCRFRIFPSFCESGSSLTMNSFTEPPNETQRASLICFFNPQSAFRNPQWTSSREELTHEDHEKN